MQRGPRKLELDAELSRLLGAARAAQGIESPAHLNLDRLQDVEAALAIEFGDDVLGLFCAGLGASLGIAIERVIGLTATLHDHKRGDLVAIGKLSDGVFVCVGKRRREATTTLVLFDPDNKKAAERELLEFVRSQIDASDTAVEIQAELFRSAPESTMQGRRVRHKIFGEGRLLSESGKGDSRKVKVDFPGRGLKLLNARFVEFLD